MTVANKQAASAFETLSQGVNVM